MPLTVPSEFVPSVSTQPAQTPRMTAPLVVPGQNDAPQLIQKLGADAMQAGTTMRQIGQTIGDRVAQMTDQAQIKSAENQFLQSAMPVLSKYKTTEGMDAAQQFDPASQAIAQARADAADTLTSPSQQRAFGMLVDAHATTLAAQMAAHRDTQQVQYGKDQSKARAQNLNATAALDVAGRNRSDSIFAQYGQESDNETLNYASLSGNAPDSDVSQNALRLNRTDRYTSVITSLLDKRAFSEAQDFFDEHKGEMDMKRAEVLGNAVKSASQQVQITDYRDRAVQSLQKTSGPGPLAQPIPAATITTTDDGNGLFIHEVPGRDVHAPASGTVTKVWNDDKWGLSAEIAMPNGYTATFNNLGAVNYKEGQKITQGQPLGLTGKTAQGQGGVAYEITGPDGKYVDPRQASGSPFDPSNFSAPSDEAKAVEWVNANVEDPQLRREAENQVRSLANTNRNIENQQHAAAVKQATDWWFQHGTISTLPAEVKMQLTPEDVDSFNQQAKAKNDVDLQANWLEHPDQMTVDAVRQAHAQGRLTDAGYLSALRNAIAIQQDASNTDPQKVRAVSVDHDQLTDLLTMNQMPNLAMPKQDADKLQRVELETAIKNEIDVQQERNNRTLTWQEKGKIARDMIIDKVYTPSPWYSPQMNEGLKPVAIATPEERKNATVWVGDQKVRMMDIPPQVTTQAMQDLMANKVPATQANIAAWWIRKGKPAQ